jgi:hypothetical protein
MRHPRSSVLALALLLGSVALPARAAEIPFDRYWHDGKAELDGYRLKVSRYGQERAGHAVMVYVTEPFSEARRVKVEDPARDPGDAFDGFKLNLVRDFQTGIYDYNTMVSVFVRSRDLSPVKVSFSSAEWCGHVYEEMRVDPAGILQQVSSYFEDESRTETLGRPADGLMEDQLYIWVRGLRGDPLRPGESRTVPFLPGAFPRRLSHQRAVWSTARVERATRPVTIEVPAGRFSTQAYRVKVAGGREGRFDVEQDYPHRIVRWQWRAPGPGGSTAGARLVDGGELTGSARLVYWRLHDNGDESYLKLLGLPVPN